MEPPHATTSASKVVDSESEAVETLKIESRTEGPSKLPAASVEVLETKSAPLDPSGPSDPSDSIGPSIPCDPESILSSAMKGDFSDAEKFIETALARARKSDDRLMERLWIATSEPFKRNLLHWAVIYKDRRILRWFSIDSFLSEIFTESLGEFINAQDVYGNTSLHLAVQSDDEESVEGLLRSRWIDVYLRAGNMLDHEHNATTSIGLTALHMAVRKGSLPIVKMIVKSIRNPNYRKYPIAAKSSSGKSALHYAAEGGDWRIVKYLVETLKSGNDDLEGFDRIVNDCDVLRQTPLYLATWKQNAEAVEVLLSEGASRLRVNIVSWEGITALDIAKRQGNQLHASEDQKHVNRRIVDMLESYDVNWLQAERSKYANAANSLLVGAALIAGVTYAGWLQPPLGYSSVGSYAGVEEHPEIHLFWVFNSMSFFFSVATFIIGADASIPDKCESLRKEVVQLRKSVVRASFLLCVAILCVTGAFASAGILVLPPIQRQRAPMYGTIIIGASLCVILLALFVQKLWKWFRSPSLEFTSENIKLSPSNPSTYNRMYDANFNRQYKALSAHAKASVFLGTSSVPYQSTEPPSSINLSGLPHLKGPSTNQLGRWIPNDLHYQMMRSKSMP